MKTPRHDIDELLRVPNEGLNVEVKSWLNPTIPADIVKIVKGTFAIRNRNGGFLIIGLDDKSLKPDLKKKPENVRATYHTDKIQSIISKYASSLFEVEVAFGEMDGVEIPVIVVPSGVRFPVATKAHLDDPAGKRVIDFGQVYFRTLRTNGTPSTAVAQPQDWEDIVEICFENREADLGRFLRRLVGGGSGDIAMLLDAVVGRRTREPGSEDDEGGSSSGGGPDRSGGGGSGGALARAPLRDQARAFLDEGMNRFSTELAARKLVGEAERIAEAGSWEISLVFDPLKVGELPTEKFRQILASSNPRYTGWPVWLDSSDFQNTASRPAVRSNGWESFVVSLEHWSNHLDFYRFDPNGRFYLHRNLQDDAVAKIQPGKVLDPILVTIRIAEAVAVGLTFAKALDWSVEQTTLGFSARWTKLRGRKLESWANPMAYISPRGQASDDTVVGFTQLRADIPTNAIAPAVEELVRPLFVLFDGFEMPSLAIESWVQRLLERKL
jgi:hypothetical protein